MRNDRSLYFSYPLVTLMMSLKPQGCFNNKMTEEENLTHGVNGHPEVWVGDHHEETEENHLR